MAESSGSGLNWAQKTALWLGMKSAALLGRTFSLTDGGLYRALGGGPSYAGKTVTDQTAMQVSTVWACVRVLAEGVGQLPKAIYRKQKSGNLVKVEHALGEVLIDKPNADMTSPEYFEALMTNIGLRGNGISLADRGSSGRLNSLYPIPTRNAQWKRLDNGDIEYKINDRGHWQVVPTEQIWHNRIFSLDGLNGLSPIAHAREAMGFSMGLEEFGARLFGQGANVGSIIKIPGWLKPDQRVEAEKKLLQLYQGLVNAGKPFLLEGGMEMEKGILPPEDAQFLQLRGFQAEDICRFYLVPQHRVGLLQKATNNNIEQLSLEFVMYTLLPYLVKIERSVDRWLFKPRDRGDFVFRFNYDGLLRADSEGRSKLLATLLQNGVINRNEARDIEHRGRSEAPGMDDYTVQSNMTMVQFLEAMSKTQGQQSAQSAKALAELGEAMRNVPAPVTNVYNEVNLPEQKAPVTNVYNEVNLPEQKAPVTNVHNEVNLPEQPAPDVNIYNKGYPAESVETIERGKDKEMSRITRKNKD